MKKMFAIMVMMMTIAIQAAAMSYTQARQEALYLSDKMAYELGLSVQQYADVYEINLDYFLSVNTQRDLYGLNWQLRNRDLRYVLTAYQYDLYMAANYFYRPMEWSGTTWRFRIYTRYTNHSHFFYTHPTGYSTYRGGNMHQGNSYYANRHYTQPTPMGSHNWRDNASGNHGGKPHANPGGNHQPHNNTAPAPPKQTTNHGTTATPSRQTQGSWRQGASGNRQGSSNSTNNQQGGSKPSTRSNSSSGSSNSSSGSGNFHGRR